MAKDGIHPPYHPVVFKDSSTGALIITRSTMTSEQKIKMDDGKEYPLVLLEITSDSHPFYTGEDRLLDKAGRAFYRTLHQHTPANRQTHLLATGRRLSSTIYSG